MAKGLTALQRKVRDFIVDFQEEHGQSPTQTELQAHFNWKSRNSAQCVLAALEAKQIIKLSPGKHRCIQVIDDENTCEFSQ